MCVCVCVCVFIIFIYGASQVVLVVKNPPAAAGDTRDLGSIPGSGRSPAEVHGNPLQYSWRIPWAEENLQYSWRIPWAVFLNPMGRGAWWAMLDRSQRVRHNWNNLAPTHRYIYIIQAYTHTYMYTRTHMYILSLSTVSILEWITLCHGSYPVYYLAALLPPAHEVPVLSPQW